MILAFATASQAALTGYDTYTCDLGVSGITYVYADAVNTSCTDVCIAADGMCVVPTYTVADSHCVHNALAFFGVSAGSNGASCPKCSDYPPHLQADKYVCQEPSQISGTVDFYPRTFEHDGATYCSYRSEKEDSCNLCEPELNNPQDSPPVQMKKLRRSQVPHPRPRLGPVP